MKKIIGFMHIYAVNDYKQIVEDQARLIEESALLDAVESIYYVVIGNRQFRIVGDKYFKLAESEDFSLTENYTLNKIRWLVKQLQEDKYAFYIHTKGVTRKEKSIQL